MTTAPPPGRPWLRQYDADVPHSLAPYDDSTLLDVFDAAVRAAPDQVALSFEGAHTSYSELDRLSDVFAAALRAHGVCAGDRVALLLPNCPQFLIAELGAWKAGAVVVPLNPTYSGEELARPLALTGVETVVVLTPFYRRLKAVQAHTRVKRVIATSIKEHLPPLRRALFTLFKERPGGHRVALSSGDLRFAELLRAHATAGAQPRPRGADTALILMSGGTTGPPKGVVCPHRSVAITARQAHAWVRSVLGPGDSVLQPLPLFHAAAGVLGLGAAWLARAVQILVPNPRDVAGLVATLRRERPVLIAGVPTLFSALLRHPAVAAGRVDFSCVRLCFCGAAPLHAETRRRFETLTGGRIVEVYSLTEALVAPVLQPLRGPTPEGSVGVPGPDVELRFVDPETRRECAPGELGEILLRAPQIMPGYWDDPAETSLALERADDGGGPWLHTGDLGYRDAVGFVFLVDRLKELMKPNGMQVWPREVEEVVAAHPCVAEVGVTGVPDQARGEAVVAWVVRRPGTAVSAEEIRAWCKERLAPFKVPARVEFRAELPKSLIGKVLRRLLREEALARAPDG